jgi:serine protease Do
VFLLRHVSLDYGTAVRDGRVVNAPKYDEVSALVEAARARYLELRGQRAGSRIDAGLRGLEAGIRERDSVDHVRARVDEVVGLVFAGAGGLASPSVAPELQRGRDLYLRDCAPCHGQIGAGDGWAAPGMSPSPGSLRDPAFMNSLSPQHVMGAIVFGIDGTAMPLYEEAYASGEAWDVASFVMTLKDGFESPPADPTDIDVARRLERTFTQVAERILPSVVGISLFHRQDVSALKGATADQGGGWQRGGLEDYYPGFRRIRSRSGVLASEDGYVLTCGNLLEPADAPATDTILDVEVQSGQHFRAWVVGVEPTVDLAVLKVEAPIGRQPATLGDSDGVRAGRSAIAVGDPPGPELTFAMGTISARAVQECYQDDRTSTLLQWSARIGAESFGGPLVDLDGRVIGITVPPGDDILHGGRYEGPAYALPIKLVRTLFEALKIKQSTRSPWLGIAVSPLTWDQRRERRAPQFGGIAIDNVFDPSPASRAGIRPGDILMEMDGNRINAVHDFQFWLYLLGIEKTVSLKLFRDGAYLERRTTIEQRPTSVRPR